MGVILATFLFVMISLGFVLLTVIPLVFGWLMVAVFAEIVRTPEQKERRTHSPRVTVQEALTPGDHLVRAGG